MTTNCARCELTVRFVLAVGLSLSFFAPLHGSALEVSVDHGQSSLPTEEGAPRPGVCERKAEEVVGQKAVKIGRSLRAPKKRRHVPPNYPKLPQETVGSGVWVGEVLINKDGKVAHVWPIRKVKFVPPFPPFNDAITDAIQQWEFEPLLVQGKPAAFCMTVTVNINWQ